MTTRTNRRLQGRTEGYEGYEEERKVMRKKELRGRTTTRKVKGYEEERNARRKNSRQRG